MVASRSDENRRYLVGAVYRYQEKKTKCKHTPTGEYVYIDTSATCKRPTQLPYTWVAALQMPTTKTPLFDFRCSPLEFCAPSPVLSPSVPHSVEVFFFFSRDVLYTITDFVPRDFFFSF